MVYLGFMIYLLVKKRERLVKVLGALASIAGLLGDSSETLGVVSKDLKEFIQSDTDEIPNSLKQLTKITRSNGVSESTFSGTRALNLGILRGYRVGARKSDPSNSFTNRALDKLSAPSSSGFVSVVVGTSTKNVGMTIYASRESNAGHDLNDSKSSESSIQKWVDVIAEEKGKKLVADCIQQFVSTIVTVYLEKTMDVNPYDHILSGLTNPNHQEKVKDLLVTFCNDAIETLVKTSHQVITNPNGKELALTGIKSRTSQSNEFMSNISSTLAVPSNRKLIFDVTGSVTFATVRSFLDFFFLDQLSIGMKRKDGVVHEDVIYKAREIYRYVSTKSYTVVTICLTVWLHVLSRPWGFAFV